MANFWGSLTSCSCNFRKSESMSVPYMFVIAGVFVVVHTYHNPVGVMFTNLAIIPLKLVNQIYSPFLFLKCLCSFVLMDTTLNETHRILQNQETTKSCEKQRRDASDQSKEVAELFVKKPWGSREVQRPSLSTIKIKGN